MRVRFVLVMLVSAGLLVNAPSTALLAQAAGVESGQTTFSVSSRAVVEDVVVTRANGDCMRGLHAENFVLAEDRQTEKISFFEEHTSPQPAEETAPPLAPNIFVNVPRTQLSDSVTVLLLDSLNTPLTDQENVHKRMLKYLLDLKPGGRMAVFTLGTRLRLVQGFTDDPSLLAAVIASLKSGASPQTSPLLRSKADDEAMHNAFSKLTAMGAGGAAAAMRGFDDEQVMAQGDARVLITLNAFRQLADYLAGIPGRKNVAWFSGAFPMVLIPNGVGSSATRQQDYQESVRRTGEALTAAQVAVYPIAAEGLAGDSLYDADKQMAVSSAQGAQTGANNSLQGDAKKRDADHAMMDEIAENTGGEAFYNTNGLNDALARVAVHGSCYYTLSYTPGDAASDGRFRRIQVKVKPGNYRLAYRRGYYALDAKVKPAGAANDPMAGSMKAGLPASTQIPLALRVQRGVPGGASAGENVKMATPTARYSVDFVIAARGLRLDADGGGGRHGKIEAALVVYDREGAPLNWMVRQIDLQMDAARYAQVQASGVNFRLEIDAPGDAAELRSGVYDYASQQTGTLEVPLTEVVNAGPDRAAVGMKH